LYRTLALVETGGAWEDGGGSWRTNLALELRLLVLVSAWLTECTVILLDIVERTRTARHYIQPRVTQTQFSHRCKKHFYITA